MISNNHKRMIAFYMIKELKDKINRDDLIDWFIALSQRNNKYDCVQITVKELVNLAENIGIEVRI